MLGLGLVLILAQILKSVTHWFFLFTDQVPGGGIVYQAITWTFPFVVAVLVFGVMFRTFPSRSISWLDVLPGAVLSGIGWELLKWLFVFYAAQFANWQAVYGPVASVNGLLPWLYLSFTVILFGAEFAAAMGSARAARLFEREGAQAEEIVQAAPPGPMIPIQEIAEERPEIELRSPAGGLLSGTAAGVIGAVAAVAIGMGVVIGGVRRWGRPSSD